MHRCTPRPLCMQHASSSAPPLPPPSPPSHAPLRLPEAMARNISSSATGLTLGMGTDHFPAFSARFCFTVLDSTCWRVGLFGKGLCTGKWGGESVSQPVKVCQSSPSSPVHHPSIYPPIHPSTHGSTHIPSIHPSTHPRLLPCLGAVDPLAVDEVGRDGARRHGVVVLGRPLARLLLVHRQPACMHAGRSVGWEHGGRCVLACMRAGGVSLETRPPVLPFGRQTTHACIRPHTQASPPPPPNSTPHTQQQQDPQRNPPTTRRRTHLPSSSSTHVLRIWAGLAHNKSRNPPTTVSPFVPHSRLAHLGLLLVALGVVELGPQPVHLLRELRPPVRLARLLLPPGGWGG